MQRSSIIATVVAAGGILIAGSVASVAVINAASSSSPSSETVAMVAVTPAAIEPVVQPLPSTSTDATALPSIEPSALPALPSVEASPYTSFILRREANGAVSFLNGSSPWAARGSSAAGVLPGAGAHAVLNRFSKIDRCAFSLLFLVTIELVVTGDLTPPGPAGSCRWLSSVTLTMSSW